MGREDGVQEWSHLQGQEEQNTNGCWPKSYNQELFVTKAFPCPELFPLNYSGFAIIWSFVDTTRTLSDGLCTYNLIWRRSAGYVAFDLPPLPPHSILDGITGNDGRTYEAQIRSNVSDKAGKFLPLKN